MKTTHRKIRGISLVEMMLVATIMSLVALAVTPLFNLGVKQSTALEARNTLKTEGQKGVRIIGRKLQQCKRLFHNTDEDRLYLHRIQWGNAPAPILGSHMPRIEPTSSMSPSSSTFVPISVGNQLFFASVDNYSDMELDDGTGHTRFVRIDISIFNYFYLAYEDRGFLQGIQKRHLHSWKSVRYADYNQLMAISNVTVRANAVKQLLNDGIELAWDVSAIDVTAAFYTFESDGEMTADPNPKILVAESKKMMQPLTGLMAGKFQYSISPNTSSDFKTTDQVPSFGINVGDYPSGFEAVVVGPSSSRQVFIRLVQVAKGTFNGLISHEDVLLINVRDIW